MSTSNIPGVLDLAALAKMHYLALSPDEQVQAIRRMARAGQGVYVISSATGLSVEQVRRILRGEEATRGSP